MICVRNLFVALCVLSSVAYAELVELNPSFKRDVRYATTNNFTGKQVYPSARCFLQRPAAMALDEVAAELKEQGLGLVIFDAYRPLRVQKIFWQMYPDEKYVANPAKGSRHNRGCAVDLSLIDLSTGHELSMPSGFDEFSARANRNYDAMEPEACKNCKLLETVMEKHGFKGLPSEWWHFDFVGNDTKQGDEVWRHYPVSDIDIDRIAQPQPVEELLVFKNSEATTSSASNGPTQQCNADNCVNSGEQKTLQ